MRTLIPCLIAAGCLGYWLRAYQELLRHRKDFGSNPWRLDMGKTRLERLRALMGRGER